MKIAFVIDDPHFHGGAHVATYALIDRLRADGHTVDVVSPGVPTKGVRKWVRGIITHLHIGWYPDWTLDPDGSIRKKLSTYDAVCCLGEPSFYRKLVSNLPSGVRKVILIHTDYVYWRTLSPLTREYTRYDRWWYSRYDCIGVVGKENARKMSEAIPQLANKIKPFHNLFFKEKRTHVREERAYPRIVTLMRVGDPQKRTDRYLEVIRQLKDDHIAFDWYVYGGDEAIPQYNKMIKEMGIDDCFHLEGYTSDPMSKLAEADLSALLSDYEGLPNTIYESFLCGTPVFATNVGSVAEQIQDGVNGWLVENDTEAILNKLRLVLTNPILQVQVSHNLKNYEYDNNSAYREQCKILGIYKEDGNRENY